MVLNAYKLIFFYLKVLWKYSGEIQPLKLMARDTISIGKNISTKAIGKMEREVIIYKLHALRNLLSKRHRRRRLVPCTKIYFL